MLLDIVDDALIADIKKDLEKEIRTRVQKGTLSETVSVKKGRETYLVSWLENYVNKQLFKKLSKKLGAIGERNGETVIPGAYIDFLNDPKTFDIITKALPIKSIKKSYNKLFPTERIGRELTAEGNPVFRIKKIDKKVFLTYFVEGKKSTILERQKQLFREILEPLAKQVVADYATPENISNLKEVQSLAPAESIDVVENIVIDAQLNNLESKLDRYKGEKAGFDIIQFSKTANGKFDRKEVTSSKVKKALNLSEHSEEFLALPESLQMATNWVRESLQLKGATLGGLIYEILTIGRVDANTKTSGINIKVKTLRGSVDFDSNRPDIELTIKKKGKSQDINYELKQSPNARYGQTTLAADFNKDEIFSVSSKRKDIAGNKVKMKFDDMPTGKQLKSSLESVQKDLKEILNIINKIDGTDITKIPIGGIMSIKAVDAIKKSKAYKRIAKVETGADGKTVADHYNAKDTHLMQIGGIGTLLMGPDIYGLNNNNQQPIQNLTDFKFKGNLRIKFNYRYKDGKRVGASISLISEPTIADPKSINKSPINLDTNRGTQALYDRIQFSKTKYSWDPFDMQTGKQRRQADLSWQLASLFSSADATLEQIQSCKDKFHGELAIDEEALELLFAAAQTKWIDYAKLLSFRHDATAMSLRDIELAAKAKMTEISISHLKAQQKIAAENEKLRTTVYRDPLTDVLNRRAYEEQSSQAFARCCRVKSFYSLLVVDIDYFKECNDSYGHQIGDEALIHIAKLLTSVLREYDNVYRYGGEEFIVTLSDCNQEMSLAVAERLRELVESNPLRADGKVIRLTISVGVVSTEFANAQSVVELFEMADKCLYRAKASGRNQCILMTQDILDSLNFESTETIEQT